LDYRWQTVHEGLPAAEIARSPAAWDRLAKDWLVEVIERTPLADVDGLPVGWIAQEAPPLIAEILGQLSDPGSPRELVLPPATRERAAAFAAELGAGGAERLPRELAALQALLIQALGREIPERDRGEFARAVGRLAEVFGAVQSAALESLVRDRSGHAQRDPETGLPGPAELNEWLRILIAETRRSGAPFSLAHLEVEGVERIAAGYGEDAAWRMVAAVAAVVSGQLAGRERAFRVGEGQIVVLAEGREARALVELGLRLSDLVEGAQSRDGPRVAVSVGVASHPAHGERAQELLDAAEEAAWAARAAGELVALAREREGSLQDP
jgi:diguanylate cyclase (GGDEF)-like protein